MKLAAIDIGSNAVRLQTSHVIYQATTSIQAPRIYSLPPCLWVNLFLNTNNNGSPKAAEAWVAMRE